MRHPHRRTARLFVVLAALGLFAGGVTATASAAQSVQYPGGCEKVPGGWLC